MLKLQTGLKNKKVFEWIMNKIRDKTPKLYYHRGKSLSEKKKYQTSQKRKSEESMVYH